MGNFRINLQIILLISLLGCLSVGNAVEETKPYFIGEDPGPVYVQIVRQWAEATDFAKNASDIAVAKIKMEMERDPKYKKILSPALIADLEQFFYELFGSRETLTELAKLYAQYFTLDEMNELVNFYKTPLGVKLTKSNAELTIKSQQIAANLFKKHEREYMSVLAKYLASSEKNKKQTPKSATTKKPEPLQPELPKPEVPKPKSFESDMPKPSGSQSDVTNPGLPKPNLPKPGVPNPDSFK